MKLEFLGYITVENEKYLGVASVRIDSKYVVRYKIVPKKDGSGTFPATAALKVPDGSGDRYIDAFMFEMASDKEAVTEFVKAEVRKAQQPQSKSVFSTTSTGQSLDKTEQQEQEELPF